MAELDVSSIDLATLAWLAGAAANEHLLQKVRGSSHPNIRNSHGYVFQHLLGGPRTVGDLAKLLGVTQQAASKAVVELEELGYVIRRIDGPDRRTRTVELTRRGWQVVKRARAARSQLEGKLLRALGPHLVNNARQALIALLDTTGAASAVARRQVKPPAD